MLRPPLTLKCRVTCVEFFKNIERRSLGGHVFLTAATPEAPNNQNNYDLLDFFPLLGGVGRVTAVANDAGVTGATKCAVSGMPTARLTRGWRSTVV